MYRSFAFALLLAALFVPLSSLYATVSPEELPPVQIQDKGELLLVDDEVSYRPWSSELTHGKVHVLQYIPATRSGSKVYSDFTDLLKEKLPAGSYHVSTILNLDEAMWGTSGMVLSELTKNKRQYPRATMVIDADGLVRDTWQLGKKGAAIAIIDRDGSLLFFRKGRMSDSEFDSTYDLVRSQVEHSS